jgi:hypothetical protein
MPRELVRLERPGQGMDSMDQQEIGRPQPSRGKADHSQSMGGLTKQIFREDLSSG